MTKKLKKELYKNNIFNFIIITISSILNSLLLLCVSILLERILFAATEGSLDLLIEQLYFVLFTFILTVLCSIVTIFIEPKYRKKAMLQYKNNIYSLLLNKSIDEFNENESSVYLSSLTNDINYIEENYIFSIFRIIGQVSLFIGTIVLMLLYNPLMTLFAVVLSLLPLVIALLFGNKLSDQEKAISDENSSFLHFIKDNFMGFSVIKVFKAEKEMKEKFKGKNDKLESLKAKKVKTLAVIEFIQTIAQLTAQIGVFFIGAYISIKNNNIGPSVIIIFVQLMNYVMSPLVTLPTMISKRSASLPLIKKIADILDEKEEKVEKVNITLNNSITIKDLSFGYDEKIILNNINYTFNKNKSYAIVGTTGSGKTTLLNLLIGRNNNYEGNILYDNNELKDISIDSLFEITSYVEQNVFVFDDSILNNITMYNEVDTETLMKVIKKSGLDKLVNEKGLDYQCGENGCNLSGGEKQRISIARGILKGAKILLMDEATSSLDNETSTSVMNNIMEMDNMTKIVITHRLEENILKQFDEIIVLKNGIIVENGNFDTLMKNNYIFKSLYEMA